MPGTLRRLNPEWGVSIARNFTPGYGVWPLVMLHSPGLAYAFDSDNTGLDSPEAAMAMLTALGLHEIRDPYDPGPEAHGWSVLMDRPADHDEPRYSVLRGPHPIAGIGPLARGPMPPYWRDAASSNGWWCQLLVVSGTDFAAAGPDRVPELLAAAANEHRLAGATVRVHA